MVFKGMGRVKVATLQQMLHAAGDAPIRTLDVVPENRMT